LLEIRELEPVDAARMLPLNNAHASETSLLDEPGMLALLRHAFYCRGADGGATAFLIAFDQNAPYDNPNFNWFRQRYQQFLYIDRVIVADRARGAGLARRLYEDLFARAHQAGHTRVVCEVNIDPPNPVSDAFHVAMQFTAVGQAVIHDGAKTVRYLERVLV
jgi:hypothetical protein